MAGMILEKVDKGTERPHYKKRVVNYDSFFRADEAKWKS